MGVTVWRHKLSAVFHYRFQVNGKRIQRSTRLRLRAPAEDLAAKEYANALIIANGGQPIPTLREMFDQWTVLRAPVASCHHRRSVDVVRRLHLYDLGDKPLNLLTTETIESARNRHLETHAPSTVNHWLRVIKLVVNWAVAREILPRLPWKVKMMKVQKKPRSIMPMQVVTVWLAEVDAAASNKSMGTAIRMMFGAGLREAEAAGARWEWMDWERGTYTPGETKGREAVPVPLPAWLLEHLAPLRKDSGLIAPRADGNRFGSGFARRVIHIANQKSSVNGITPHRLRGSFATLLLEAGATLRTVQEVMRHKSPLTTMEYIESNMETVVAAQQRIAEKTGMLRRESGAMQQSELSET